MAVINGANDLMKPPKTTTFNRRVLWLIQLVLWSDTVCSE